MRTRTHMAIHPNVWKIAAALLTAATLVFATAQATDTTSDAATSNAEAAALQQQALRLELLNELPEEARADATLLLDRIDALQSRALDLRTRSLEARVAALEAGEPTNVAHLLALQAVLDERITLARDTAVMRDDLSAFVETYPEATAMLRYGTYAHDLGRADGFARGGMLVGAREAGRSFGMSDRFGTSNQMWPMRDKMRRHR